MRLIAVARPKFRNDLANVMRSFIPAERPIPKIGDISGDINIAPMITAGELVSRPMLAIKTEQINIQSWEPPNAIPLLIPLMVPSISVSSAKCKRRRTTLFKKSMATLISSIIACLTSIKKRLRRGGSGVGNCSVITLLYVTLPYHNC